MEKASPRIGTKTTLRPFFQRVLQALMFHESRKPPAPEPASVEPRPQKRFKALRTGTVGVPGAFGWQPYSRRRTR